MAYKLLGLIGVLVSLPQFVIIAYLLFDIYTRMYVWNHGVRFGSMADMVAIAILLPIALVNSWYGSKVLFGNDQNNAKAKRIIKISAIAHVTLFVFIFIYLTLNPFNIMP